MSKKTRSIVSFETQERAGSCWDYYHELGFDFQWKKRVSEKFAFWYILLPEGTPTETVMSIAEEFGGHPIPVSEEGENWTQGPIPLGHGREE